MSIWHINDRHDDIEIGIVYKDVLPDNHTEPVLNLSINYFLKWYNNNGQNYIGR